MKRYLIAGNFKMNKTISETAEYVNELLKLVPKTKNDVVICPQYLALEQSVKLTEGSVVKVGAQNMHWEQNGVYTGEISAEMLKEIGVQYVIIGHSSRRENDNETDDKVNKKLIKALEVGLIPILCVGETKKERAQNRTYRVLKKQLLLDFDGITNPERVVVAYEPLWAISDGKTPAPTPTGAEISVVNSGIKRVLRQMYGAEVVKKMRILYGGSVSPSNAAQIMAERSVNGVLVGGACLNAEKFASIVKSIMK